MVNRKSIQRKGVLWVSAIGLALNLMSCSDNRAPVVRTNEEGSKDYREMLTRVRDRRKAKDDLALLRKSIEDCQIRIGRLPTNLVELVRLGYVEQIPTPPSGAQYMYDPVRGRIDLIRQDGGKRRRRRK